jgi:hypothetical protein
MSLPLPALPPTLEIPSASGVQVVSQVGLGLRVSEAGATHKPWTVTCAVSSRLARAPGHSVHRDWQCASGLQLELLEVDPE